MNISNVDLNERKTQLQELSNFICNAEGSFYSILNTLNWDVGRLREQSTEMVTCPLNKEHYIPKDKLEKHIASCSWRMDGYHEDDVPLPESGWTDDSSIVIDRETRTAVIRDALAQDTSLKTGIPTMGLDDRPIPKTADRLTSDFTVDERRILYDFVIQKTKATPTVKMEELEMSFKKEEKERPKTYLERLAAERDAKRRKVSKKVHTNRKSHVEIMREVIQNQMELYEEHLKHQCPELRKNEDYDSDHSASPSRCERESPARRRENRECQQDEYKHRNDPHGHCSSYEESRDASGYRSHRKPDYDRREKIKYRDRNSSSYYRESGAESRSGSSYRKHTHEDRDRRRFQDDRSRRSKMYESHSKQYRETSYEYDNHGKRKRRERSRSNDSKSRTVRRDRSESYELQSKGSCYKNEACRSERKEKNNSVRGEKYRDRSSSSESQYRKRMHRKSYTKEHSNNTSSDMEEEYQETNKSRKYISSDNRQHGDNDCVEYVTNRNNSESNSSYHLYVKKEKLDTEENSSGHGEHSSISYGTEKNKNIQDSSNKHTTENEDVDESLSYRYEESNIRDFNDSCNYLETKETDMNTSLNKSRHKRKKHKKHKKYHKKSAHKPVTNEHSSEDFSC